MSAAKLESIGARQMNHLTTWNRYILYVCNMHARHAVAIASQIIFLWFDCNFIFEFAENWLERIYSSCGTRTIAHLRSLETTLKTNWKQ